jgi:hypothetical protein
MSLRMICGRGAVRPHRPESTGACGLFLILVGRAAWSRVDGGEILQRTDQFANKVSGPGPFVAQILTVTSAGLPGKEVGSAKDGIGFTVISSSPSPAVSHPANR